jgi:hypothetical protein
MKNKILFSVLFSVGLSGFAQVKNMNLVLFGAERVNGSYTGINKLIGDDEYRLQNLMTFRLDFISAKDRNFIVDFSWPTIRMFNLKDQDNSSTYTRDRFYKMDNQSAFRLGTYKLKGSAESKGIRYGFGYQMDYRYFGIIGEKNPITGITSGRRLSAGPLEKKGRLAVGGTAHLVKAFGDNGYTRLSLNLDYSPGKIQGVSLYPELLAVAYWKHIGLYFLGTWRYDYLKGNRHADWIPLEKDYSIHTSLKAEVGIVIKT